MILIIHPCVFAHAFQSYEAEFLVWFVSFCFLPVLRSMVTATAFQVLVSNNAAIKAVTDNTVVTLEVRAATGVCGDIPRLIQLNQS